MDTAAVQDKPAAEASSSTRSHPYPEFDSATMLGQISKYLLDTISVGPLADTPWTKLRAYQQEGIINTVQEKVRHAIREITFNVAAKDFAHIEVTVGEHKTKGELFLFDASCARTRDNGLALLDVGRAVLVLADEEEFLGVDKRDRVKPQPDQPGMFDQDEVEEEPEATVQWAYDFGANTRTNPETGEVQDLADLELTPELQESLRKFQEARDADEARRAEAKRKREERKAAKVEAEKAEKDAAQRAEYLAQARDALANGAERDAVLARLKDLGIGADALGEPEMPETPDEPAAAA